MCLDDNPPITSKLLDTCRIFKHRGNIIAVCTATASTFCAELFATWLLGVGTWEPAMGRGEVIIDSDMVLVLAVTKRLVLWITRPLDHTLGMATRVFRHERIYGLDAAAPSNTLGMLTTHCERPMRLVCDCAVPFSLLGGAILVVLSGLRNVVWWQVVLLAD